MFWDQTKKKALMLFFTIALFLTGCASSPKNTTYLTQAVDAIKAQDYAAAVFAAERAVVLDEDARYAYRYMGIAYMKSASYREAINAFRMSLSRSDGVAHEMDFDMNRYMADCYMALGEYAEAVNVYNNLLAIRHSDAGDYVSRGEAYLLMNALTEATADFDKALSVSPRDFDLRIRIFQAFSDAGYEEAGKAILNEALGAYHAAMSNYEKGLFAYYLGNNAEAQSLLERALYNTRGEEQIETALLLGQTGERQKDFGYAISTYTSILELHPDAAALYNRRGLCYMQLGEYANAIADFEAGLATDDPAYRQALLRNEITASEYAGNFSKAKELMKEYSARYPDDAEGAREAEFLESR